jgi:hypothetical protein
MLCVAESATMGESPSCSKLVAKFAFSFCYHSASILLQIEHPDESEAFSNIPSAAIEVISLTPPNKQTNKQSRLAIAIASKT